MMLASLSDWLGKHVKWKQIFLLIAADVAILAVMNYITIPLILKTAAGMKLFDLKYSGYTPQYVQAFINAIGEKGKGYYLKAQLPLDCFYPLVYGSLYLSLANKAFRKLNIFVFVSIIILCVSDYAENTLSFIMLSSNSLSNTVARTASVITVIKTDFLYITVFLIAFGAAFEFIKSKRK